MNVLKNVLLAGAATAGLGLAMPQPAHAAPYQHVLLISVDGLHGIDLQNWIANPAHAGSTLTALAKRGIVYQNAFATAPSDSFPGMLAQVTGATPLTTGVFYDDSFDRTYFAAGSNCVAGPGQGPGVETNWSEALDKDSSRLDAGGTLGRPLSQIDRTKLPLSNKSGTCKPVLPHQFNRANTVFEVIKAAGLRTAWSDKHPSYEILNGPSGQGIDDLYTPEVNSDDILGNAPGDNTKSFTAISVYDQNKVNAVLHQIDGFNSTGTAYVGTPAILGMNFQAVSVGQKLATGNVNDPPGFTGGYLDSRATPGNALTFELTYVDGAIGQMVAELKLKGLYDSTLIIVSAKHGQSPIDPTLRTTRDDGAFFPATPGYAFEIADDEVLLWLDPAVQRTDRKAANAYLQGVKRAANLQAVYRGEAFQGVYKNPLNDARTPDFIGVAVKGTIYTTGTKLAEHGGFADDDRHVAMVVSGTGIGTNRVEPAPVATTQIAPTILAALGLDPNALKGVQNEGTQVLPGVLK